MKKGIIDNDDLLSSQPMVLSSMLIILTIHLYLDLPERKSSFGSKIPNFEFQLSAFDTFESAEVRSDDVGIKLGENDSESQNKNLKK